MWFDPTLQKFETAQSGASLAPLMGALSNLTSVQETVMGLT